MKGLNSLILRLSLSLVVTLILGALFFTNESPYKILLKEKRPWESDKNTSYSDLDSDGKTERILLSNSAVGQVGIVVYNHDNNIIDQYNLVGRFVKRSKVYSGDYNDDGLSELYVFTYIGDSLFLNILDVYNLAHPELRRKYISGCKVLHGEAQYIITAPVFEDVNDDSYLEFYFAISAGFTLQPRALYYYDIVNDRIKQTDPAGAAPRYFLNSYDIDGDGKLEIWGNSNAVGNYKSYIPYSDSSAWLMIYNSKLEYKFEPYEYKGFTSVLCTHVLETKNDTFLVAIRKIEALNNEESNNISIFSTGGKLLLTKSLEELGLGPGVFGYCHAEHIFVLDNDGNSLVLDHELNVIKDKQKEALSGRKYGPFKMENSGYELLLNLSDSGELIVFSSGIKKLASLYLDDSTVAFFTPIYISNSNISSGFHLRTSKYDYAFQFERNKARNYIYVYSLLMFAGFYFMIYFIQLLQLRQERKRQETETKMRALQMQTAKSQMNPHFIFNALNSISAMYIKGDTERADAFLISFSKMIREVVDSSDRLVVRISDEIEFVRNYLELEQVRHEGRLSFSIDIPAKCMDYDLPSMSIHTFVENSIKHGLRGKNKMHIRVNASCDDSDIVISIQDNGVGYDKAQTDGDRKGRGLQIIADIFDTYHDISGKLIEYSITDLGSVSDKISGTKVEIRVKV